MCKVMLRPRRLLSLPTQARLSQADAGSLFGNLILAISIHAMSRPAHWKRSLSADVAVVRAVRSIAAYVLADASEENAYA